MKNWINGAWATCVFELRRSFTMQRTAVSIVLTLFPPFMILLLLVATRVADLTIEDRQAGAVVGAVQGMVPFMIIFLVSLVCLLSLLLWATPNVYSELEGKSWSFVASRPGGRVSIYLGKFFASVIVSFGVSFLATSLCIMIADILVPMENPKRLWMALCAVYLLASVVYGAVFSLIGTLFFKRGMVVAAGYLVGSEIFLASIPALVSKLTVRYHLQEFGLQAVGFYFLPFDTKSAYELMYGKPWPIWAYVLVLLGVAIVTLIGGAIVITNRQYITSDEA